MSTQKTKASARAQNAQPARPSRRGKQNQPFRNAAFGHDLEEIINKLNDLQERSRPDDTSEMTGLLAFVAEAYFERVRWVQLLHYIVNNVPDTRGLPLWRAIMSARQLYRLLDKD